MTNMFEIDDLIKIAKRENNSKRSYLYINSMQGKHVPVSPSLAMELFSVLAEKVEKRYSDEKLLIIGFAETATAIGSTIAYQAKNVEFYMNTTREDLPNAEHLFFTESHSHATEQRLVVNGFEKALKHVGRIVFAEDEVTTGNTIVKLVRILQEKYSGENLKFGIVSILNSMSDERLNELEKEGLICDYLHRIPVQYRVEEIENHTYLPLPVEPASSMSSTMDHVLEQEYWNCRTVADIETIRRKIDTFVKAVKRQLDGIEQANNILVLGTEEFMFPGMLLGSEIENCWPDKTVRFHATTRSPIEISSDKDYPLHNRIPLESLYSDHRRTFIYNFERYDKVLIVTDANPVYDAGLTSLVGALEQYGNHDITMIQWGDFDHAE